MSDYLKKQIFKIYTQEFKNLRQVAKTRSQIKCVIHKFGFSNQMSMKIGINF
jgi:hypothetical protein